MQNFKLFLLTFLTLLLTSMVYGKEITLEVSHPNPQYGIFSTYYLKVEPLNDNTNRVRLLEDLIFIDSKGKKWTSPKGSIVDGATIPKAFQGFIGTPYAGEYVLASVIHDIAYEQKKESWQEVHRGFHDALLASGVEPNKAAIMYMAVYEGSERWGEDKGKHLSQEKVLTLLGVDKLLSKDLNEIGLLLGTLVEGLNSAIEEPKD